MTTDLPNVRFTPKADIAERDRHVRFVPKADMRDLGREARFTSSGHARAVR